jgi:hypothetical protein
MRHPFFNLTHLVLREGEADFHLQLHAEGLTVTLGPNTGVFVRPGATVSRGPGAKILARRSPHPIGERSWLAGELDAFLRVMLGGGDVKLSMIKTLGKQREALLTAGDGAVVEKLDIAELAKEGAPALQFLQPAYVCSSARVSFRSTPCDASTISWARAPYVFQTEPPDELSRPAILCLAGRTMVWSERLEPGESRDFALGSVIAATVNLTSRLRPTSQCHPDDWQAEIFSDRSDDAGERARRTASAAKGVKRFRLRGFVSATQTLLESIRAREGFFVCEVTNHSRRPAFVYIQLNRSGFYGGTGLIGLAIQLLSAFFRLSHLTLGH